MSGRSPADRVRERLVRWMDLTGLSQREFAKSLHKTQVWLQKVLAGKTDIRLKYLDQVADAMRTTPSELVRTDEERYQLELTPTEVRVIEQLRRHPDDYLAIAQLLRIPTPKPETASRQTTGESRGTVKASPKTGTA